MVRVIELNRKLVCNPVRAVGALDLRAAAGLLLDYTELV